MELKYSPLKTEFSKSFYLERKVAPYFGSDWHYHNEYELLLTLKGEGLRIVGDNIDQFTAPELIFMGTKLPHLFKNKDEGKEVDYIILKFGDTISGQQLFNIPEFKSVKKFLDRSNRGILFSKEAVKSVQPLILEMFECSEIQKLLNFIKIFEILSTETECQYLASENFSMNEVHNDEFRIQKVMDFMNEEYYRDITLDDLADIANMTKNSFCRYFKNKTGKTPFQVIREYRINKACQMLINGNKSITEVCFDTGFNSFSTFNRIFKNLKNISASEYKNQYTQLSA